MVSCVFPGSFDPITKGHLNLISRASAVFEHVTVTVMNNIRKKGSIPIERRVDLIRKACADYSNVDVERWDGLLADYMHVKKERIILRGIRNAAEMDSEMQICAANKLLNNRIETIFLPCDPSMIGISSSAVREIASFNGNINEFVPDELTEEISELLSKKE